MTVQGHVSCAITGTVNDPPRKSTSNVCVDKRIGLQFHVTVGVVGGLSPQNANSGTASNAIHRFMYRHQGVAIYER
jgi:hypothetical protein